MFNISCESNRSINLNRGAKGSSHVALFKTDFRATRSGWSSSLGVERGGGGGGQ
jgi:hypothetical protein